MSQRSSHLVAIGKVSGVPVNGTWSQLTLTDPAGNAIAGNTLPGQCTRVQFSASGFTLGVDSSATPTWVAVCGSQPFEIDVVLGGSGKKVAVTSEGAALTGTFTVYFYA